MKPGANLSPVFAAMIDNVSNMRVNSSDIEDEVVCRGNSKRGGKSKRKDGRGNDSDSRGDHGVKSDEDSSNK